MDRPHNAKDTERFVDLVTVDAEEQLEIDQRKYRDLKRWHNHE